MAYVTRYAQITRRSPLNYKSNCKRCKVTYVGQIGRRLNTKVEEPQKESLDSWWNGRAYPWKVTGQER